MPVLGPDRSYRLANEASTVPSQRRPWSRLQVGGADWQVVDIEVGGRDPSASDPPQPGVWEWRADEGDFQCVGLYPIGEELTATLRQADRAIGP